jgi:hypothetical protein
VGLRRYVAPAAFLLAATIAVVVIHSGLRSGKSDSTPPAAASTRVIHHVRPRPRFWTVRAGDTFAVIASKTGVPLRRIERLNPKVTSTSLFIGERLRLR